MNRLSLRCAVLGLAALTLAACDNNLEVTNPNNPDGKTLLGRPADAEALMANYYKRWHEGLYRTTGNFEGMANVMSFQNFSDLANDCQNQRLPFSGATNNNSVGNNCEAQQKRVYQVESEVNRVASTLLKQMDEGLTLGTPGRDARYRAFGEFLRGLSLGYLALFYDSAAVVASGTGNEDP